MRNEKWWKLLLRRHATTLCWVCRVIIISHFSFFIPHSAVAQKVERGIASYYGKSATGRMTSNGERLHHDSLTCAHKRHPFGTLLKVTNLENGKEVVVRVTDRGPFGRGRIIDLSWRAAQLLGILQQGICRVELEVFVPTPPLPLSALPPVSLVRLLRESALRFEGTKLLFP